MRLISCEEFEKKLKFAFKNIMNVLVEGKHGVGKTSIIHNVLEAEGLILGKDYVCFSAATMDPWIDFLGIPRLSENNGIPVVKLVKPEYIDANSIQVLFFDEFNRAPKRVRNAVMELIQFKSVNGVKFPKLKCIWAAVNPDDDSGTYDVERIDPAQLDRFQLQFQIKEELNIDYFIKKFGEEKASSAKEWYESLDDAQKNAISPRRVQYALEILKNGGGHIVPYLNTQEMCEKTLFYYFNESQKTHDGELACELFSNFTPEKMCPKIYTSILTLLPK